MDEVVLSTSTKDNAVYTFRTVFNPIRGVDEDITEFISRFAAHGSLRFTKFAEIWRSERFIEIIYGRRHQAGLYDILGCIFYRLVTLLLPESGKKQIERICALYMLYAFYGKQPVKNHVRIRVCPDSWKAFLQLSTEARDEGHLDVYYVFKRLFVSGAFLFCATRQILYPGVPLFDSPQMVQPPPNDFGPTTMRKERNRRSRLRVNEEANLQINSYWQALALPNTSRAQLNEAFKPLDASLMKYAEAKRALNPDSRDVVVDTMETEWRDGSNDEDSVEAEEFLPGLNFITYPGCLAKVLNTMKRLEDLEHEAPTKTEPSVEPVESSTYHGADDSQDYQVFPSLLLETVSPEDPVTDQITESCSRFIRRKRATRELQTTKGTISDPSSNDEEVNDIGERRRLLRQPETWSKELAAQSAAVRKHGHHHNRRRPTERKVLKRRRSQRHRQT